MRWYSLLNFQNYQLRLQQEVHYKTLVKSSKDYEDELDKGKVVVRDEVEVSLINLLDLRRKSAQEIKGMQGSY